MLSPGEFEKQQKIQPEGVYETRGNSGRTQLSGSWVSDEECPEALAPPNTAVISKLQHKQSKNLSAFSSLQTAILTDRANGAFRASRYIEAIIAPDQRGRLAPERRI